MITIDVPKDQLNDIAREFSATDKEIEKASWRALRKTAKWIKTQSLRKLSKLTGIKRKVTVKRVKQKNVKNRGIAVEVWYGTNPISMIKLDPRQKKRGVKAGKTFRDSAFIVPTRKGSSSKQVYKRRGSERLPVDKQVVRIEEDIKKITNEIIKKYAWNEFVKKFEQEMKWQITKRS